MRYKTFLSHIRSSHYGVAAMAIVLVMLGASVHSQAFAGNSSAAHKHIVTIYDDGKQVGILTDADTVGEALHEAHIDTSKQDLVEPSRDEKLLAKSYQVNIYRARPIVVIDGASQTKIISPYHTAKQIAEQAGIVLHDQDKAVITHSTDIVRDGAVERMEITRAVPFTLLLYGKQIDTYTQGKTVQDMLREKGIKLGKDDTISSPEAAPLLSGMTVAIWRNGAQTVTTEQPIDFETQSILDFNQPVGYRVVKTPGVQGKKAVSYQIVMQQGHEVSRSELQSVVISQPTKQVEVLGAGPSPMALSRSKGAQMYTDSKGVAHRETYYDLPMNVTMGSCGGGTYTVRPDGAKIDKDGYILVAAHLGNYPRCSIVETSLGPGKVYDTGGFVARHPHGFDLATDWSNNDGR